MKFKMKKEFNLSEKISTIEDTDSKELDEMIFVKYVKEFIKLLKEELDRRLFFDNGSFQYKDYIIDKLAGKSLS